MSGLPPTFKWSEIGPDFIKLSWDVTKLGRWYANIIKLSAMGISYPFEEHVSTEFLYGSLTLDNLKPNSTYEVTVKVIKTARFLKAYTNIITTAPRVSLRTQF